MGSATSVNGSTFLVDRGWRLAAIGLLAVRFVQGWIYWGGGTRRFIYGPQKLDAWGGGHWMAYKFQTAMPGALLGTEHLVSFLLQHFVLLYVGVIVFSLVELFAGFMLITGLLTRIAALTTIGLSFVLMLLFGWQGATCIDEWTMAASNFAMGVTLLLVGGGAYSLDNWLLAKKPGLAEKGWFRWMGGSLPLPLSDQAYKKFALVLFWIAVAFIVGTYSYYRGSVVTPFHGGPVSPSKHHWSLSNGRLQGDGTVTFHAYVDAGTPEAPSNVLHVTLVDTRNGSVVEEWDSAKLAALPKTALKNDYDYQKIHIGKYGITGPVGSKATIILPPAASDLKLPAGTYTLKLNSVNGSVWTIPLQR